MGFFRGFRQNMAKNRYIRQGKTVEEQLIRRFQTYGTKGFTVLPSAEAFRVPFSGGKFRPSSPTVKEYGVDYDY